MQIAAFSVRKMRYFPDTNVASVFPTNITKLFKPLKSITQKLQKEATENLL